MKMTELTHPEKESYRRKSKVGGFAAAIGAAVTPLSLALLSALAGCTALLDTTKSQCSTEEDCTDRFGDESPYLCIQHVCERPICEQDSDCRKRGGRFSTSICSLDEHQCVPAECTAVDGCDQGQACQLSTNRCVARECSVTQDCLTRGKETPTVQCVSGFCKDDVWGCIGKPDDRPREPGAKGTLEFQLLSGTTNAPIPNAVWDIKVCGGAQFETVGCDVSSRPPGAQVQVDVPTGVVRISGLNPDNPVRIWIDETSLTSPASLHPEKRAIVPMEFVTQKPPVGVTTAPPVLLVLYEDLATLIKSYGNGGTGPGTDILTLLEPGKASIYASAYDCQDNPAAQVQPSYRIIAPQPGMPAAPTGQLIFYFDEGSAAYPAPDPRIVNANPAEWTFGTGLFATLNLPPATNLNIMTSLVFDTRTKESRPIRETFASRLTSGRMTTIHFYPRNYTLAAAP
jgi:hypothetical protein